MNTHNAGGGEVLDYWGQNNQDGPVYLDTDLIKQFLMLPFVKLIIILLLIGVAMVLILKLLEVRSPFKGKALTLELEQLDRLKRHDASIIRSNNFISNLTKIVQYSPLQLNKSYVDYWTYNLSRADIRIPGGYRVMRPEEFNALITAGEAVGTVLGLFIGIFWNIAFGVIIIILSFVIGSTVPMSIVRATVKEKDNEIIANFADFYLMIHYVLLASSSTPLAGIMKSYDKTTSSQEMHKFVDVCIHYMDTYGEYESTRHIAKQYREIPEVGKLMRLIRQAHEGGDIRAELVGFRDELLAAKKYAIEKRMEKLIMKARASFNLLTPVLIQAIISAMAIYFDDLGAAGSFF